MHQVEPREKLVGAINADQVLARDFHEMRQPGASAYEHRLEALGEKLVQRAGLADNEVRIKLDAQALEPRDFFADDRPRQAKWRNAVGQYAA